MKAGKRERGVNAQPKECLRATSFRHLSSTSHESYPFKVHWSSFQKGVFKIHSNNNQAALLWCARDRAQVAQRSCGVSSLEMFRSHLDTLLWVSLLEQGLDLVTSRGLFKLQPFFDSRQTMFCYSATFATFLHKTRHMCLILCENTSPPPQILGTWVTPLGLTSDFSFKGQMNEEVGIDVQLVSLHMVN